MRDRGFSLIEALVSISILTILILAQMQMMANQARNNLAQAIAFDFQQFIQSVDSALTTPSTCDPALSGQPFVAGFDPLGSGLRTPVTYVDSTGALSVGVTHGKFKFTQMELQHIGNVPLSVGTYDAAFNISADRIGEIVGPRGMHRSLRLTVVAPAGVVTDCYSTTNLTLQKICQSLLGVFDPTTQVCGAIP